MFCFGDTWRHSLFCGYTWHQKIARKTVDIRTKRRHKNSEVLKMNEELERIKHGLINGSKLDVYDRELILKIINNQQKQIDELKEQLAEMTADRNLFKDIAESCECNN